jgi:hypothetical protein
MSAGTRKTCCVIFLTGEALHARRDIKMFSFTDWVWRFFSMIMEDVTLEEVIVEEEMGDPFAPLF